MLLISSNRHERSCTSLIEELVKTRPLLNKAGTEYIAFLVPPVPSARA